MTIWEKSSFFNEQTNKETLVVPHYRLRQAEKKHKWQLRIVAIGTLVTSLIFLFEFFVALQPGFNHYITLAGMIIATVLGGVLAAINAMWSLMAGLRRGGQPPLKSFLGWIDRSLFYIIFVVSLSGILWTDMETWALWVNIVIPLRWLYDVFRSYIEYRRVDKKIQKELQCPLKIEVARKE